MEIDSEAGIGKGYVTASGRQAYYGRSSKSSLRLQVLLENLQQLFPMISMAVVPCYLHL
jgi:hypothetical protein